MPIGTSRPRILRKDFIYDAYDAFQERGLLSMARGSINHIAFLFTFNYAGTVIGRKGKRLTRDELRKRGKERERIWYLSDPNTNHIDQLLKQGHHPVHEDLKSPRDKLDYRPGKPRNFDRPFVTEIPTGIVAGSNPIALTAQGQVVIDSFDYQSEVEWSYGAAIGELIWNDGYAFVIKLLFRPEAFRSSIPSEHRYESLVLLDNNWARSYSHWTFEHLPKLRAVEHYRNKTENDPKLVIEPNPPKYKIEMLQLMNYVEDDWIELPNNSILADTLVMPSYPAPNQEELMWVRDRILSNVPESVSVESPDRILLLRPDNIRRQLDNREAVKEMLNKYGFVSLVPENLSVAEQAVYFSEAELIVGAHGSALTNMIWSNSTTVVEMFTNRVEIGLYMLAEILGHSYQYILCDTIGGRHLQVDLEKLESTIISAINKE